MGYVGPVWDDAGLLGHADPMEAMVYVDDDPAERERPMLLAADEPTTLDLDRETARAGY